MEMSGIAPPGVIITQCVQEAPFHRVARHMVRQFGKERLNPVHIGKPLVYFADADTDPDPAYRKGAALKGDAVKGFFRTHVKQFVLDLEAAGEEAAHPGA